MIKLLKCIYDEEGVGGIVGFMFMGTFCLSVLLLVTTPVSLSIHEAVNQCHVLEES